MLSVMPQSVLDRVVHFLTSESRDFFTQTEEVMLIRGSTPEMSFAHYVRRDF